MVVSRLERDRRPWSLGALALSSCFDTPDPPWLLDESVEILAVRADVIEDGPVSGDLGPVPADRLRAEALPGDTVRATVLAASLDGVATPAAIDAAFFMCRGQDCVNDLRDDEMFTPCGDMLYPGEGCSLGRGPEATFTMPPIVGAGLFDLMADVNVGVVMGTPEGPDTADCVERLRQRPYPSLAGCSLFHHWVFGGPYWKVTELSGTHEEPGAELPPHLQFLPPNFSPEVERFEVGIANADDPHTTLVPSGGRMPVAPGDVVHLAIDIDSRDLQSYLVVYGAEVTVPAELPLFGWFADTPVATATEYWNEPAIIWTVPDDTQAVSFVVTMEDGHGGVGWGTIAFDVEGVLP